MDAARTLLLVEDNPGDVRLVVEMLRDFGADVAVTGVKTQAAAIDRLARHDVDVVLLDLGLPDSQGLETFTRLHDASPGVAIIVLTGNSDLGLAIRAVEQGAQDFLVKDRVNGELLTRSINYAIERKHAEQELAESEARYRALAEGSPLAVFVCRNHKDDDTVVLVNAACVELFRASSPEELNGRSALDLFHRDSQPLVRGPIHKATGATVPFIEARIVRVDGTPLDVDIAAAPLLDQGMPAIQVVLRDITEIKKAHERAARLAAIVTSSPDAILTKDLHEVITSWNPAAEALFGYRAEEAIGAGMEVLLPPGLKAEPKRLTKRLLKGEKVEQFETQRKRKDGSLVYVALTLYPIRDERGHIAAISVVAHDITKRKQTEEVLWESEERYRSILDASPDGIVITDLKGRVLMASPAGLTMLGYDREDELLGRPLTDFIALEDRGRGVSNLAAMLRGDRAGPDEYRGLRADGSTFAGEVTGGSILGADGQPASLVFVVRDISQRRQAEEERLRAEGFFRDTFEHADVGIAHVNSTDGTWLRVNQRMCDLLGYTREELLRTTFAAITHPDDVEENVRHLRGMLAGEEETYRADKRYLRKDGSIVWVHLNVALIRQEDGTPDYNITVMTDITERMQAEEALAASERFRGHLLDTTPSLIYIYDLVENRNLYTNREITEFLGYTSEEILALGPALFLNLLHPDDAVLVAEHHERLRKLPPGDDSVLEIDYRMKRSDGEWRWLHSRDVPFLRDGSGVVTRILGSTDDVTEPKVSAELAARQAQRIEQTLTSVVDVTSDIVELRDPYTAGHQRRVTELAVKIAESLGLSGHEIDDIRVAGLLHDMGKAAVPTEILSKPGQLSPVEFELVKGHGEAGYRLAVSAHMAEPVAQMIHQHHERCDGSGYPQGLTGDQTLLGAKVLAVADVVEAMTSYRPYRSALGIEAALAEIERGSGRLYDARVADACVRLFNEDGFEFSKQ